MADFDTPAGKNENSFELRWLPVAAGAFALLVALAAVVAFTSSTAPTTAQSDRAEMFAHLGGNFTLTSHTGEAVSLSDFEGKTMLIYFGYSYCPDVCPIHLTLISAALERLGRRAERFQPLFVSVDPERDTPDALASYVPHFHDGLVGLTGSTDEVYEVAARYAVAHEIVEDPDLEGYLVNHTSAIYAVSDQGEIIDILPSDVSVEGLVDRLAGL